MFCLMNCLQWLLKQKALIKCITSKQMTSNFTDYNFIDIVNKETRGTYEKCDLGETKDILGN